MPPAPHPCPLLLPEGPRIFQSMVWELGTINFAMEGTILCVTGHLRESSLHAMRFFPGLPYLTPAPAPNGSTGAQSTVPSRAETFINRPSAHIHCERPSLDLSSTVQQDLKLSTNRLLCVMLLLNKDQRNLWYLLG